MGKYRGLDLFRLFATLLIIAIHTSPLQSINSTANFILTGIISRVAVPFFFMVTGFFIVPKLYSENGRVSIIKLLKKISVIYLISLLIYLPVTIYTTDINNISILTIIRGLIFYGDVYHLWYLPATILGVLMIYLLSKKFSIKGIFIFTIILYVIGVLGDSYYGIINNVDSIKGIFNVMFILFINTRNGLFFAPMYLVMGAVIYKSKNKFSMNIYVIGLIVSLILFVFEGIIIRPYLLTEQDNMYILLIPCMYFLFKLLLFWKGTSYKVLRKLCLLVYIVHPIYIFLLKKLQFNSIMLFVLVTSISFITCIMLLRLLKKTTILKY